ncbi:DUF6171 family protein [Planctomicrobium sp. SH664]|uniref:DUF6171 family protein n=1 Tax=Planctomicrobium sp. SH664 TaxID=3448125 RepID=UPI003F5ADF6B
MTNDQSLPSCNLRVSTPDPTTFLCRHTQVRAPGQRVSAEICRRCSMREVPCPQPRDLETLGKIPPPAALNREQAAPARFPSLLQQGWNLASSLASFIADGARTVSPEEYQQRLEICDTCELRHGSRCLKCGCHLAVKAQGKAFHCPVGRWATTYQTNNRQ